MSKKANGLNTGTSEPEAVDEFMFALRHPMKDVMVHLRKVILTIDKTIGEGIYWNAPCFYYTGEMKPFNPKDYKRYLAGFNFFKQDTIRLIFLRGADVEDPAGILEGDYKDGRRLVLIRSMDDAKKKEKDLKKIVKQLLDIIGE